ncbi:hypothetical protein ES703_30958 [subsurface metagenome]
MNFVYGFVTGGLVVFVISAVYVWTTIRRDSEIEKRMKKLEDWIERQRNKSKKRGGKNG